MDVTEVWPVVFHKPECRLRRAGLADRAHADVPEDVLQCLEEQPGC